MLFVSPYGRVIVALHVSLSNVPHPGPFGLHLEINICVSKVRATPSAGTEDATGPAPISVSAVFTIVLAASSLAGKLVYTMYCLE